MSYVVLRASVVGSAVVRPVPAWAGDSFMRASLVLDVASLCSVIDAILFVSRFHAGIMPVEVAGGRSSGVATVALSVSVTYCLWAALVVSILPSGVM